MCRSLALDVLVAIVNPLFKFSVYPRPIKLFPRNVDTSVPSKVSDIIVCTL